MSDRFAGVRTIQDPLLEEVENGRLTNDQLEQVYEYMMQRVPLMGRKSVVEKGDPRFTAGRDVALNKNGYIATSLIYGPGLTVGNAANADTLDGRSANQFAQQDLESGGMWRWRVPQVSMASMETIVLDQRQGLLIIMQAGGGNNLGLFHLSTAGTINTVYNSGITLTDSGTGTALYYDAGLSKFVIKNRAAATVNTGVIHLFRSSVAN